MDTDIPLDLDGFSPVVVPVAVTEAEIDITAPPPSFLSSALARPARPPAISSSQLSSLLDQGFTKGLAQALHESANAFPLRIWVVDNSGSMRATDGNRFVHTSKRNDIKVVECTRWREIQDTVGYHASMAALLQAPTAFRMLNDPGMGEGSQKFGVACSGDGKVDDTRIAEELRRAKEIMQKSSPGGVTPLALHIREIRDEVAAHAARLRSQGQRVAIVLATDGLPTDNNGVCDDYYKRDFVDAIKSLEDLPVWVVVRLCTDDADIVEYYNEIDAQLEISIEVLDDFTKEAIEVQEFARWLNYGLPLHRCREMGFHDRVFDLLEERSLTKDELRDFCRLLFGIDKMDGVPEPSVDMRGFCKAVKSMQAEEAGQWNPVNKKVTPWIDLRKMKHDYGVW
eukprot:CAMPEP_0113555794 /NCGR_PEP_ID=MMETSP0015_2-20120614/16911_1 /TAXON_ID=2838 /ORGANISM="Odontella" /LENGTH=396 /DNA_ID=CAMNT_0000457103 /DNA_START=150 /DNA_END=1337 /DNA_ORIENTATION=- /assembly_acc=CAM_ASM_000160